jgi:serine/threonine-protein kinase
MHATEKKKLRLKQAESDNFAQEQITKITSEKSDAPVSLKIEGLAEKYELKRLLGQGGMGSVYLVLDKTLLTEFAIKFMSAETLPDETAVQRFKIEAAAVHELSHPNIAQVYDFVISDQSAYILMEYVPGTSFERVLARERVIEQSRLLNMMNQICEALSYAHLHGVVHRDLKPSNIILHESSDLLKLVDFGIAKVGPQNASATQLTQKGEVFGSPAYMSPEQARASKLDHRSDLYSLGCIMYEAIAGKPLFEGENAVQVMLHHITSSPSQSTRKLLKKGYSKSLVAVLEKLLEKDPDKRYQSASELSEDIKRVQNNQISKALLRKPFLISVSKTAGITALATALALSLTTLCIQYLRCLAAKEFIRTTKRLRLHGFSTQGENRTDEQDHQLKRR